MELPNIPTLEQVQAAIDYINTHQEPINISTEQTKIEGQTVREEFEKLFRLNNLVKTVATLPDLTINSVLYGESADCSSRCDGLQNEIYKMDVLTTSTRDQLAEKVNQAKKILQFHDSIRSLETLILSHKNCVKIDLLGALEFSATHLFPNFAREFVHTDYALHLELETPKFIRCHQQSAAKVVTNWVLRVISQNKTDPESTETRTANEGLHNLFQRYPNTPTTSLAQTVFLKTYHDETLADPEFAGILAREFSEILPTTGV